MLKAIVFQSGNSQAVRIPKEIQTTEKEFIIRKYENCYFLIPANIRFLHTGIAGLRHLRVFVGPPGHFRKRGDRQQSERNHKNHSRFQHSVHVPFLPFRRHDCSLLFLFFRSHLNNTIQFPEN